VGELSFLAIAKQCGVDRRTLQDWRADPAFQLEVQRQCRAIAGELVPAALARLRRMLKGKDDKHALRAVELVFRAARWGDGDDFAPPVLPGTPIDQPQQPAPAPAPARQPGTPRDSRQAYRDLLG
jgi:hypothetical protein